MLLFFDFAYRSNSAMSVPQSAAMFLEFSGSSSWRNSVISSNDNNCVGIFERCLPRFSVAFSIVSPVTYSLGKHSPYPSCPCSFVNLTKSVVFVFLLKLPCSKGFFNCRVLRYMFFLLIFILCF